MTFKQRFLSFLFLAIANAGAAQVVIYGQVLDSLSGEVLPFASIRLASQPLGTTSNSQGAFKLEIAKEHLGDSLVFSFIGYNSKSIAIRNGLGRLSISLSHRVNVLSEVVVNPIVPEEMIRRAMRRIPVNYASEPFTTQAYYRQVFRENEDFVDHSEAVFLSYHDRRSKNRSQHQVLLYREPDNLSSLKFMRERMEKQRDKYIRKNPEKADSIPEGSQVLRSAFGGPGLLLTFDVTQDEIPYLDTNRLYYFRFVYGEPTVFEDRELLTIDFESKGSVENARRSGTIFIDNSTEAIVSIEEQGRIVVPTLLKPLLLLVGLSIRKPTYSATLRYRMFNDRWYPELVRWNLDLGVVNKRMFRRNVRANMYLEQLLHVHGYEFDEVTVIRNEKRFNPRRNMADQVFPQKGLDWSEIDVIH